MIPVEPCDSSYSYVPVHTSTNYHITVSGRPRRGSPQALDQTMALRQALGLALCISAAHAEPQRRLHEHNPTAATVKEVHMVLSSHFDAGCKTPGCTLPEHYNEGEPRVCAKVGAGNAHGATDPFGTGEPWAYHIVNRCTSTRIYCQRRCCCCP